jgi:hypothetical protein
LNAHDARSSVLYGAGFRVGGLYAWPITDDRRSTDDEGVVCPSWVEYFGQRYPERFPSVEEYRQAVEDFPEPMLASVGEALRLEDAEAMGLVYAASGPLPCR